MATVAKPWSAPLVTSLGRTHFPAFPFLLQDFFSSSRPQLALLSICFPPLFTTPTFAHLPQILLHNSPLKPFSPPPSGSFSNSFVEMKTKRRLPKYFYSCSLTKRGEERKQKDVQAYLSGQQKDGKLPPCTAALSYTALKAHCLKFSSGMAQMHRLYICVRLMLCQAVRPPVGPGDQMKLMADLMCLSTSLTPVGRIFAAAFQSFYKSDNVLGQVDMQFVVPTPPYFK